MDDGYDEGLDKSTCQLLRMKALIDTGILPSKAYKIVFGDEGEPTYST